MSTINPGGKSGNTINPQTLDDVSEWANYPAVNNLNMNGFKVVDATFDLSDQNIAVNSLEVQSNAHVGGNVTLSGDISFDDLTATGIMQGNDIRARTGKVIALAVQAPGNFEALRVPGYNQTGMIFASLSGWADSVNFGQNIAYDSNSNIVYNQSVNTSLRNAYILSAQYDRIGVYRLPRINAPPGGGNTETLFAVGNTGTGYGSGVGSIINYLPTNIRPNGVTDVAVFSSNGMSACNTTITNVATPINATDAATKGQVDAQAGQDVLQNRYESSNTLPANIDISCAVNKHNIFIQTSNGSNCDIRLAQDDFASEKIEEVNIFIRNTDGTSNATFDINAFTTDSYSTQAFVIDPLPSVAPFVDTIAVSVSANTQSQIKLIKRAHDSVSVPFIANFTRYSLI